jgi:hypothetical protein
VGRHRDRGVKIEGRLSDLRYHPYDHPALKESPPAHTGGLILFRRLAIVRGDLAHSAVVAGRELPGEPKTGKARCGFNHCLR